MLLHSFCWAVLRPSSLQVLFESTSYEGRKGRDVRVVLDHIEAGKINRPNCWCYGCRSTKFIPFGFWRARRTLRILLKNLGSQDACPGGVVWGTSRFLWYGFRRLIELGTSCSMVAVFSRLDQLLCNDAPLHWLFEGIQILGKPSGMLAYIFNYVRSLLPLITKDLKVR